MKIDLPSAAPRLPGWTLLGYLNGDGDVREEVTRDLVLLHQETTGPEVRAVVSLFRGGPDERNEAKAVHSDWRGRRTYLVRADEHQPTALIQSDTLAEAPVSDWKTLRDFLVESTLRYPSERYALAVSGHANREQLVVNGQGQGMAAQDFARALQEARQITGRGVDVVLFESCEVAHLPEVVDRLTAQTEYLLASPTPIETGRIPWSELLATMKESDLPPARLASAWQKLAAPGVPSMRVFQSQSAGAPLGDVL